MAAVVSIHRGCTTNDAELADNVTTWMTLLHPEDAPRAQERVRQYLAKEIDKALNAYRKALHLEPGAPPLLYNIGTAHALKSDTTAAFE